METRQIYVQNHSFHLIIVWFWEIYLIFFNLGPFICKIGKFNLLHGCINQIKVFNSSQPINISSYHAPFCPVLTLLAVTWFLASIFLQCHQIGLLYTLKFEEHCTRRFPVYQHIQGSDKLFIKETRLALFETVSPKLTGSKNCPFLKDIFGGGEWCNYYSTARICSKEHTLRSTYM